MHRDQPFPRGSTFLYLRLELCGGHAVMKGSYTSRGCTIPSKLRGYRLLLPWVHNLSAATNRPGPRLSMTLGFLTVVRRYQDAVAPMIDIILCFVQRLKRYVHQDAKSAMSADSARAIPQPYLISRITTKLSSSSCLRLLLPRKTCVFGVTLCTPRKTEGDQMHLGRSQETNLAYQRGPRP